MQKITALIIDDHRVVSEGLAKILESDGRFQILGLAASLAEAQVLSKHHQPDAVLVDLRLPDSLGYSAIDTARELFPEAKILAITGYGDLARVAAKRHGADAFLTKELASDKVAETLAGLFPGSRKDDSGAVILTRREAEVARLVASGLSNEEVADALSVSINTVKTHLSAVLSKMQLRDRVALALHFHRKND
ncbi:MAG TPA: response regulator transcription factor [Fimbriimonadaceae bacterium]|nr:response regulator transcription factor [Fimbriimonadaceae bacterium]